MYRYWSGLHETGDSKLVVSNDVGDWLPLRVNAPAEIVHLTLRAGEAGLLNREVWGYLCFEK